VDFPGPDAAALANATKCPVVGVSGTVPLGPSRFVWANDATGDAKRIADALKRFADRIAVSPGRVVLVGFDEGAQVALEVAARDGSTFAGAVALSPSAEVKLDPAVKPSTKSRFVLTMGTRETFNREVVKQDRQYLTATKAAFEYVEIPNGEHRLPADLLTTLPKWVEYVLDGK
jgi:predicted esterase